MQQPNNVDTNGQESKNHNLHFMFLTYVTRNQGHGHKPGMNLYAQKRIVMQSLGALV